MKALKIMATTSIFALALNAHAQVLTDSLILDLPLNGDAMDQSGNGNNGTVYNAVADTNRLGVPNSAFRFNGVDSYIEIPASPSINQIQVANEITITAWINIHQWYNNTNVFSILERYDPNTDLGWGFEANWAYGGIAFFGEENGVVHHADCGFTWNFDQWYHIAMTYSQAQGVANFYLDGVPVCSTPYQANINIADTTDSFAIGRSLAGPDEYSDGLIDDLKVYYRVLSAADIDTAFAIGVEEKHLGKAIAIYPNPAKETLTVGNLPLGSEVTITDITGKRIYHAVSRTENLMIGTMGLGNGIYFIQIENGGAITTKKFVVNK